MTGSLDWINLLVRWAHLGFGIAWIGASFYFVWLDRHLTAPAPPRPKVEGEIWMVHSGGFYRVEKRRLAPGEVPAVLHWFKYEALFTWVSGAILLVVVYYATGGAYLVDPTVSSLASGEAVVVGVSAILLSWLIYDWLWVSPLGTAGWPATALSLALLAGVGFALMRLLSGRAAYIHVGAILGTIMVANVWHRILPAQRRMIAATRAGREADWAEGLAAKRRSIHNSYMTFPVLFLMLSSHFPQTYAGAHGAWVLALLIGAGVAVRHAMIGTRPARVLAAVPAAACLAAAVGLAAPSGSRGRTDAAAGGAPVSFGQARAVINRRCLPCHSRWPTDSLFALAPNGVTFDTPEDIARRADRIRERAVVQQTMPLANRTGMTPAERDLLRRWLEGGAGLE